jgi:hypothetical protein
MDPAADRDVGRHRSRSHGRECCIARAGAAYHGVVRVLVLLALGACAASADLGVLQRGLGDGAGGSLNGHLGIGAVQRDIVVVDMSTRIDVTQDGSRLAFGGSVLGGLPIGAFRLLGRAGVWHAPWSSASERTAVPTFELAAYVPLHETPSESDIKYGWNANGVVIGVREDLDVAAYTTIFVAYQLFLIPGY